MALKTPIPPDDVMYLPYINAMRTLSGEERVTVDHPDFPFLARVARSALALASELEASREGEAA